VITEDSARIVRPTRAIEGVALDLGAPRESPAATDSCQLRLQGTKTLVIVEEGRDQEKDTMGESIQTVGGLGAEDI
jgi:hypothetical protein